MESNISRAAMVYQQFVVIVDPFSSGALLAAEFKKRGLECIALISQGNIPAVFAGSYRREDFSWKFALAVMLKDLQRFAPFGYSRRGVLFRNQRSFGGSCG